MPRLDDVIVLLPGIMGSRLQKDGKTIWGTDIGSIGSMLVSRGGFITEALLLEDDDPEVEDVNDGVVADALLPDLHLIPKLWKVDGYSKISREIEAVFQVREGENSFSFPYDWRRFNQVSARRLKRLSTEWITAWRNRGHPHAKLILVAHSMGGLVARYFLEVLGGWRDTRALITFGTPYRGSLNAVDSLANGIRKGPWGLVDLSRLARSLNSLYQLLPTFKCYDEGDGSLKRVGEIDTIPHVDPARAAAGLAFHREILEAAQANRNDPEYMANPYVLRPIVGIRQKTNLSARANGDEVQMLRSRQGEDTRGDGTVPRMSATPPERSNEHLELFASTRHAGLQNSDSVLVDLEGIVTNFQFDQDKWLGGEHVAELSLEVEDLYFDSEPIELRVEASIERALDLVAIVQDSSTGAEVLRRRLAKDEAGGFMVECPPLDEGAYSIAISGTGAVPVSDAFAVAHDPNAIPA